MNNWAILLAAGHGTRLAAHTNGIGKQFLFWRNRPLYWHSAMAFSRACCIDGVVFVFPENECENRSQEILRLAFQDSFGLEWKVAAGGERRQDSAFSGLREIPTDCKKVLIHDSARCFVSPELIRKVCDNIGQDSPCIIPAIKVVDTIKMVGAEDPDLITESLPRSLLRAVQTPQGFMTGALREAFAAMENPAREVTDEASLFEAIGLPVKTVTGSPANIKITRPEDLKLLTEEITALPCSGFGYDVHRFGAGRPLKLGGVTIPGEMEVIAHSDGDVLLHSLIDAMLGCGGLGDIGRHFPDTDPAYEAISSALLLDRTISLLAQENLRVYHADLTVVAQKPKLAPYADSIIKNVARLLALPLKAVNFKATTEEKMGFTGQGEGIKAYALVNAAKI